MIDMYKYEYEQIEKLEDSNAELLEALQMGLRVYEDFMPNIGRCAVQNYAELNEFPMLARAAIAKATKG